MALSKKNKLTGLEAESYSQLGILFYYTAQYMNAINNMKDAVELYKTINDSNKISDILNNIGLVYTTINKNEYAIDYIKQAIKIKKAERVRRVISSNFLFLSTYKKPVKLLVYLSILNALNKTNIRRTLSPL